MVINKLKINGYGNIQNKEIELNKKINIIYGENEKGKSTIFKFILNMLYGCARTKKGQEFSDFEKYKPWYTEEFSGQINYELDNKNKFEVFREFKKKNPKIYNENSEDISKQFNMDKNNGINYFYEQTNIDEELFLNSTAVLQNNVKLEEKNQNILIQKITNIANTGEDSASYKKTIEKLKEMQMNEIGSNRSVDRPINKIENRLSLLKKKKNDLEIFEIEKNNFEENKENIKDTINKLNEEINIIKNIKKINDEYKIEKEKIKINEEIILKNKDEIEKLNLEKNNLKNKNSEIKNKNIKNNKIKNKNIFLIIFVILFLINLILQIKIKNNILYITDILFTFLILFFLISKNKINKEKKVSKIEIEKIEKEINEIENKIELNNHNINEIKKIIEKIENDNNTKINNEKQKIENNSELNIENIFLEIKNIENILEEKQEEQNNKKIELHKIDIDEKNNDEKIEELISINEKINYLTEEYEKLKEKNEAYEIAKNAMENAYKKMRENITPKFVETISEIIKKISDDKYEKVRFNLEEGLIVQKENGEYISINKLSTGTIDQLYLSFRLSIIKEIAKENIPIILDEAFAYYGENRLKNFLKYLYEETNNQIIIFTCTKREKDILEKLNYEFNYIEL